MRLLFADTSALIKLYVDEEGSDQMATLVAETPQLALSQLTYAEVLATFARRAREGRLTSATVTQLKSTFFSDWAHSLVLPMLPTFSIINELHDRRSLRGADSVQLAAATFLAQQGIEVDFACCDDRLSEAARLEGLAAVDPTRL